jgi:hypothetical protein
MLTVIALLVPRPLVLLRVWRPSEFDLVLGLHLGLCLPLHVARVVSPTSSERNDMVHDVPLPAVGIASLLLELPLRGLAALDAPMAVSRNAGNGTRVAPMRATAIAVSVRLRLARASQARRAQRAPGQRCAQGRVHARCGGAAAGRRRRGPRRHERARGPSSAARGTHHRRSCGRGTRQRIAAGGGPAVPGVRSEEGCRKLDECAPMRSRPFRRADRPGSGSRQGPRQ